MKRETFVTLVSALLSEADEELLREAEGLCFWRRRELRSERVKGYKPGWEVEWVDTLGDTRIGQIHKLNKYSVTIHRSRPAGGYDAYVVPVERIVTPPQYPVPL